MIFWCIDNFATGKAVVAAAESESPAYRGKSSPTESLVQRVFAEFRPTHVVHAAASYKDPSNWREDVATNVLGTINVVEAARAQNVVRVVNFQTVLCYGRPQRFRFRSTTRCGRSPATEFRRSRASSILR